MEKEWNLVLHRMHTGNIGDECYSVLWKAPDNNYQINGVKDNERDKFYHITDNSGEIVEFIRDLNLKERFRGEHYKSITDSFERTIRESEDRFLELYYKNQELLEENNILKEELRKYKKDG